jgi:hypothetical protein
MDGDMNPLDRVVRLTARLKVLDHERIMFAGRDELDARVLGHLNAKRERVAAELDCLRAEVCDGKIRTTDA